MKQAQLSECMWMKTYKRTRKNSETQSNLHKVDDKETRRNLNEVDDKLSPLIWWTNSKTSKLVLIILKEYKTLVFQTMKERCNFKKNLPTQEMCLNFLKIESRLKITTKVNLTRYLLEMIILDEERSNTIKNLNMTTLPISCS